MADVITAAIVLCPVAVCVGLFALPLGGHGMACVANRRL